MGRGAQPQRSARGGRHVPLLGQDGRAGGGVELNEETQGGTVEVKMDVGGHVLDASSSPGVRS